MKLLKVILLCVLIFVSGCVSFSLSRRPAPGQGRKVRMEVTAYCNCGHCTGWRRSLFTFPPFRPVFTSGPLKGQPKRVGITASGERTRKGTIAADITKYPFGTRMYVPGYGWGVVQDVGGAIKGNCLDVWFPSHQAALEWGRKVLEVTVVD